MKRMLATILMLPLALLPCRSQTNVIFGNMADLQMAPTAGTAVTMSLISPNPKIVNGIWVSPQPITTYTDAAGSYSFRNVSWGEYEWDIQGQAIVGYVGINTVGSNNVVALTTNTYAFIVSGAGVTNFVSTNFWGSSGATLYYCADTNNAATASSLALSNSIQSQFTNGATAFNLQSASGLPEGGVVNLTNDLAGKAATNAPVTLAQLPSIPASQTTNFTLTVNSIMATGNVATAGSAALATTAITASNLTAGAAAALTSGLASTGYVASAISPLLATNGNGSALTSITASQVGAAPNTVTNLTPAQVAQLNAAVTNTYTFQNTNLNAGIVITNGWLVFIGTNLPASGGGVTNVVLSTNSSGVNGTAVTTGGTTTLTLTNTASGGGVDGRPPQSQLAAVQNQLARAVNGMGNINLFWVSDSTGRGVVAPNNYTNCLTNSIAYQLKNYSSYVNSDGWMGEFQPGFGEVDARVISFGTWGSTAPYYGSVFTSNGYIEYGSGGTNNTPFVFQITQPANYVNIPVSTASARSFFVTTNGVLAYSNAVPNLNYWNTNYTINFPLSTNMQIGIYTTNAFSLTGFIFMGMNFGVKSNSINVINCSHGGAGAGNLGWLNDTAGLFPISTNYCSSLGSSNCLVIYHMGINNAGTAVGNTNWAYDLGWFGDAMRNAKVPTCFMTWVPSSNITTNFQGWSTNGQFPVFISTYLNCAASNNFPVLDIQGYFGGYTNSDSNVTLAGYGGGLHPNISCYTRIAKTLAKWFALTE